jgi:hypothetical protein
MASNHRIFIAFAIEDAQYRDFLRGQARNEHSPFEFVDMSVKEPWDSGWKTKVRSRIKGCDGVIALVSGNTYSAAGARYEMQCANEEGIPMMGLKVKHNQSVSTPPELARKSIVDWTWANIAAFLKRL